MTRPRFGVCAWIFGGAPLEETLGRIAAAGYEGVEIPGEPGAYSPPEVRRLLSRHGLAPLALTASCTVPETRRDLAHPDPAIRDEAVRYVVGCLRLAAEIGAPLVQMLPSGETRLSPIASRSEEWSWSVEGMGRAAREAERLGVRICIEPLNRYEAYLVTSAEDGLAYLAAVGSPWVGLTLDLFHAGIEEPELAKSIAAAGRRLWHLHAADTNRQALGRGHLDLAAVTRALRDTGYAGSVVLEVMPPGPNPFRSIKNAESPQILDAYLRESLGLLRQQWPGRSA
ncbi:MAG TPA: sugar phosphate isomerase/epimerase family protein [Candidatus Acidoferrum sp.]|nr:sugar phosphate isomerase/epimerase family protein [Candidatus Acidoferrum sp.]